MLRRVRKVGKVWKKLLLLLGAEKALYNVGRILGREHGTVRFLEINNTRQGGFEPPTYSLEGFSVFLVCRSIQAELLAHRKTAIMFIYKSYQNPMDFWESKNRVFDSC